MTTTLGGFHSTTIFAKACAICVLMGPDYACGSYSTSVFTTPMINAGLVPMMSLTKTVRVWSSEKAEERYCNGVWWEGYRSERRCNVRLPRLSREMKAFVFMTVIQLQLAAFSEREREYPRLVFQLLCEAVEWSSGCPVFPDVTWPLLEVDPDAGRDAPKLGPILEYPATYHDIISISQFITAFSMLPRAEGEL